MVNTQLRQNKILIYAIMLLGLIGGYMYYIQSGGGGVSVPQLPATYKDDLAKFGNLNIDFSILNDANYQALRVYGELPVSPGTPGKRDIFAPY